MKDVVIPNSVNLFLVGSFLLFSALFPLPPGEEFTKHLLLSLIMLALGFVAFNYGQIGGGAVKFNAAAALWLGPTDAYAFFFILTFFATAISGFVASRLLGRERRGFPVILFGAPIFILMFLTTPMWSMLRQVL